MDSNKRNNKKTKLFPSTAGCETDETESSSEMKPSRRAVPRRPFGSVYCNPRLSETVPIIGLGCSSFSSFFFTPEELAHQSPQEQQQGVSFDKPSFESVPKNNKLVQGWIRTIHYAILDCGITLLDTAPWYGHGMSEIVVGYALEDIILLGHHHDGENNQQHSDSINKEDANAASATKEGRDGTDGSDNDDNNNNNNNNNTVETRKIPRSKLTINTKIGRYDSAPETMFDYSYNRAVSSVRTSIRRLKCSYIDVVQLHDPEYAPSLALLFDETIPAMIACQKLGLVKALGLTGYPLQVQHEIMLRSSKYGVAWDQCLTYGHCNLHDVSLIREVIVPSDRDCAATTATLNTSSNNDDNEGTDETTENPPSASSFPSASIASSSSSSSYTFAQYCHEHKINQTAAAPLSMGLLTDAGPPKWHPASRELRRACVEASALCRERHVDIARLATLYALSFYEIVPCTIIGMKNIDEVNEAVRVALRFAPLHREEEEEDEEEEGENRNDDNSKNSTKSQVATPSDKNRDNHDDILKQVSTDEEYRVLQLLSDEMNGPFARVWKNGSYRWDGIADANTFWSEIEGGREQAEKLMRIR